MGYRTDSIPFMSIEHIFLSESANKEKIFSVRRLVRNKFRTDERVNDPSRSFFLTAERLFV